MTASQWFDGAKIPSTGRWMSNQSGWISSQTTCWKRLSHSISPSPTIKSKRRKSPLAINTHLYAYFLLFSTSFSFEFEGSVNDTVSIKVDGSTHHLADRIGQQKAPTASVAAQRV
jgi:hypothetical protein